jgi:hypothetical protein
MIMSDVSITITSSILHSHLFAPLLLLVGEAELSGRKGRGDNYEEWGGRRVSVRWEHEIRNKCVHGVVLSKNANETKSDCNARTQFWYRTSKEKIIVSETKIWIKKKK